MEKNRNVRNFDWLLNNGYFDKITNSEYDIFLVDTGVFIDLENSYYQNKSRNNGIVHPARLIGNIEHRILITGNVLEEIIAHGEVRIGQRYEISEPTSILVERLYEESKDFFSDVGLDKIREELKDYHRYQVFLASAHAFNLDSRKGEKDRISDCDKEIMSIALDLCLCGNINFPIETVNILSTDDHIARTVKFLKELDYFKGYKIRAIPTRHDLRSYIQK